ncbi:MAG TPA: hypothetical protein VLO10_03265 [Candidatus Deferrimicrobium sp.]|nr:hypothetical protein [Candidatus Deferrimicrobium sp.]
MTYAESNCGPNATKAQADCQPGTGACTAIAYLDANKIYAQNSIPIAQDAQESWWLHQTGFSDAAHRVVASDAAWGNSYLLNQGIPAVQTWFQTYARTKLSSFGGLMMDDTNAGLSQQFYETGQSSSQEISSDAALLASHEALAAGMTRSDGSHLLQVDNSLNANPWLPTPFALLGRNDGVHGFIAEGQPVSGGTLTPWYASLLDDLSYIDAQPNAFIALLSYDNSGSLAARRLQAATVLLGYSAGHVVSWSDLEQSSSNLAVWPEEGLYPSQPVQSMGTPGGTECLAGTGHVCAVGGHNDVQVASGVYRREFGACYNRGVGIGPCATIVNDTSSAVVVSPSWLTRSYGHQITMVGGDVQSGGSLNPAGAPFTAGTTAVPANDAILIAG